MCLFAPAIVGAQTPPAQTPPAQTPWAVTLTPTMDPLPVGFCAAIQLTVMDASGKDAPRNALGARVTIADFDITVTGNGVVADRIDAFHWVSCACQSAKPASTATVTASYPSRSLAANARVAGVTFQRSATFTVSAAKGGSNPRACTIEATTSPTPASVSTAGTLPQPLGVPAVPRTPPAPAPAAPPVGIALPPATPPVALAAPPAPVAPGTAPPTGTLPTTDRRTCGPANSAGARASRAACRCRVASDRAAGGSCTGADQPVRFHRSADRSGSGSSVVASRQWHVVLRIVRARTHRRRGEDRWGNDLRCDECSRRQPGVGRGELHRSWKFLDAGVRFSTRHADGHRTCCRATATASSRAATGECAATGERATTRDRTASDTCTIGTLSRHCDRTPRVSSVGGRTAVTRWCRRRGIRRRLRSALRPTYRTARQRERSQECGVW